jgi:hypothetical protein
MHSQSRGKKQTGSEDGQALLEFAFVAVFLLLVIFGVIDFARLFFAYATMSNAAREGARFGITHSDPKYDTDIEDRARGMLVVIGADADVEIKRPGGDDPEDPDYPEGCTTPHICRIQIIVTSQFDMWTPVIPALPLRAQATMHFE